MANRVYEFQPSSGGGDLELPPGLVSKVAVAAGALLLLSWGSSAVYTVAPDEEAVVLRLGKLHGTPQQSGIHLKFPYPVDRVYKVPTKKVLKEEFGYRTKEAAIRTTYRPSEAQVTAEALMLSGDLNMAVVEWVVQYRITDPVAFLFNVSDGVKTLRDVTEAMMRRIVGDRSVDQVLTVGRVEIESEVLVAIQATMDRYDAGIDVQQVKLKNVKPPEPVQASFNDVNKATQDKQRLENQALASYNELIPRAEGEARKRLEAAQGYSVERINEAEGDVKRFLSVYAEYKKAPEVTRRRLYLESMEKVLPKVSEVVVLDGEGGSNVLPLLNLAGKGGGR